ncbi:SulP family inorganic anion transporter [Streptomyces sp. NPDC059917]|uniref:SulP family inorganic anion transporter n=1 Tax=Streptomyces sp. NPDC059917 TaxID=3347002 RepID=UPI003660836A
MTAPGRQWWTAGLGGWKNAGPFDPRPDVTASLVVFLVALPLCVGVAVASGVPAELGLITGIVGGLLTGLLPGSSLQVSGPAAGLTVLVYEAVEEYGLSALGVIVLTAGLLQTIMGALRLGRWFRAISVAVVEGMLVGIGLVLIVGQLYAMTDIKSPPGGLAKILALPGTLADTLDSTAALASLTLGAGTVVALVAWRWLPKAFRAIPAPLAAVALTTAASLLLELPVARLEVQGLRGAVQPLSLSDLGQLADAGVIATVFAFALVASAESLFSASAVDRLHDGPRTQYDKELMAQGIGNAVCGLLAALPMTAVIVRSAANVQAGARTKASRVLHGLWLLLFAALLPAALDIVPLAALAGVLAHAGCKLLHVDKLGELWRAHRGEVLVLFTTAAAVVTVSMFEGVLIGLAMAIAKTAWETSHVRVEVMAEGPGAIEAHLSGTATFLRLPKILDALEALPRDRAINVHVTSLHHLDHACRTSLDAWAERHSTEQITLVRSGKGPAQG